MLKDSGVLKGDKKLKFKTSTIIMILYDIERVRVSQVIINNISAKQLMQILFCYYIHYGNTVKFLNFRMPETFAEIYLKFKQRRQILRYFVKKMQMELQTV